MMLALGTDLWMTLLITLVCIAFVVALSVTFDRIGEMIEEMDNDRTNR